MPIAGLSAGGAGPSQTPSIAIRRRRPSCGNMCAHQRRSIADQREVQQGDGGTSGHKDNTQVVSFH